MVKGRTAGSAGVCPDLNVRTAVFTQLIIHRMLAAWHHNYEIIHLEQKTRQINGRIRRRLCAEYIYSHIHVLALEVLAIARLCSQHQSPLLQISH